MSGNAYLRSAGVLFGVASPAITLNPFIPQPFALVNDFPGLNQALVNDGGDGLRIQFDITRTLSLEPDRCKLTLWNLSQLTQEAIGADYQVRQAGRKAVLANKLPNRAGVRSASLTAINKLHEVTLFAGYRGNVAKIFAGDIITLSTRKRVGFTDFVTEIELGDSILLSRDGYLDTPIAPGMTFSQLLTEVATSGAATVDGNSIVTIAKILPNSKIQVFTAGAPGGMSTIEGLEFLAGMTKSAMTLTEGQIRIVEQGNAIPDFGIALKEGRDILDFTKGQTDGEIQFRVNLDPRVVPGRAIFTFSPLGIPTGGFRCEAARYVGDTDEGGFYVEIDCSQLLGVPPPFDASEAA